VQWKNAAAITAQGNMVMVTITMMRLWLSTLGVTGTAVTTIDIKNQAFPGSDWGARNSFRELFFDRPNEHTE
jgi:hypothetical protein